MFFRHRFFWSVAMQYLRLHHDFAPAPFLPLPKNQNTPLAFRMFPPVTVAERIFAGQTGWPAANPQVVFADP
jgi:hypothetical protein